MTRSRSAGGTPGPRGLRYTAKSLNDIAEEFERRATEADAYAATGMRKAYRNEQRAIAQTWTEAAKLIRRTVISEGL